MIDRPHQQKFDFPEDETIDPPAYQRETDDKKYKGISPREAFHVLNSLDQNDQSIKDMAPYIIQFMRFNRSKIEQLLQQISSGVALNAEQRDNAWKVLGTLRSNNDISNAFALWELNITPIKDERCLWPSHEEMITEFHCLMGRFRSDMANLTP